MLSQSYKHFFEKWYMHLAINCPRKSTLKLHKAKRFLGYRSHSWVGKIWKFFNLSPFFLQFLILLILVLQVGQLPTWEGPGYTTVHVLHFFFVKPASLTEIPMSFSVPCNKMAFCKTCFAHWNSNVIFQFLAIKWLFLYKVPSFVSHNTTETIL